mmetsp:Transcript_733/g.1244  ORF Transcript_733/g.1244 Transcript_733/m.1244 type:complete len:270 (-) Transcript_733:186-995(-)
MNKSNGKERFRWGSGRQRKNLRGASSAVGTEKAALDELHSNQKDFKYPAEGFVEKIEYTLLYSMLLNPDVYPEEVVKDFIAEEDFNRYLFVKDAHGHFAARSETATEIEAKVSYAQLSAVLGLSAEKFPPKDNNGESIMNSSTVSKHGNKSISETMCKYVLKTVVRYAKEHDLDRQTEIQELLGPVERHAEKRNNKAALNQVLPFYIGYAATLITANPLPMLAGAAMMNVGVDKMAEENKNVQSIANESEKRADVEKTGLLDEAEHDDD